MADKKISALTAASTPLAGTEVLPIVQSGSTVKVSVANLTAGRAVASAGGTFSDNFVQGTAAKGVNFTANTPLAGMTSQLLNQYEEGTHTPTVTSATGAITSYTAASLYRKIGTTVSLSYWVNITNNGTGAGSINITLPFSAKALIGAGNPYFAYGLGQETFATGAWLYNKIDGNGAPTIVTVVTTANAYPAGTGYVLTGSIVYTSAA